MQIDLDAPADSAATMARMGYDGMLKATTLDGEVEVGLVGPSPDFSEWFVAVHVRCDPDKPDEGYSERNDYPSYEEAEAAWRDEVLEHSAVRLPSP